MGPKKRRAGESSSQPAYDSTRFLSLVHQQKYENQTRRRNPIRERGLILQPGEYEQISGEVERRGWWDLLNPSSDGSLEMVRDFYANAYVEEKKAKPDFKSFYKGREVLYDWRTVDRLLGLNSSRILIDAYSNIIEKGWSKQEVLRTLCVPGAEWVQDSQGYAKFLKKADMLPIPKIWCTLVQAKLLPSSNHSEVTVKRALLVFCIMGGKDVDISRLLSRSIYQIAHASAGGLGHPGLITRLCMRAGVDEPIQTLIPSERPITAAVIQKIMMEAPLEVHPPPLPPQTCTLPGSTRPNASSSRSREFGRDQALLHLHRQNQTIGSYFMDVGAHLGVSLSPFPQPNPSAQAFFDEVQQEAEQEDRHGTEEVDANEDD